MSHQVASTGNEETRLVMETYSRGRWTATNTATHLEITDNKTGAVIRIEPSQVSDLIIALMATNPTENPEILAVSKIGEHHGGKSNTAVQRWFKLGYVPGAVTMIDSSHERRGMLAALVDEIKLQRPGNPDFYE